MKPNRSKLSILILAVLSFSLLISACQFDISRNADGSLSVDTSISQEALQTAITAGIADPLIKNLTASLQSGYILVSAERERLKDPGRTDKLTFRLDMGVTAGKLIVTISNALLDGVAVDQERVNHWNETIAARLQKIGQKQTNTTLKAVTITSEGVSMNWLVEKK
jgi:hypothetical protein